MTKELVIVIIAGVISGLITAALLAVLKWQLRRLKGAEVGSRLASWIFDHLKHVLLIGAGFNLIFLAWILIKFPTVELWTVLVIVLAVAITAVQFGIFLLLLIMDAFSKLLVHGLTGR
jgi:hypothetical protein